MRKILKAAYEAAKNSNEDSRSTAGGGAAQQYPDTLQPQWFPNPNLQTSNPNLPRPVSPFAPQGSSTTTSPFTTYPGNQTTTIPLFFPPPPPSPSPYHASSLPPPAPPVRHQSAPLSHSSFAYPAQPPSHVSSPGLPATSPGGVQAFSPYFAPSPNHVSPPPASQTTSPPLPSSPYLVPTATRTASIEPETGPFYPPTHVNLPVASTVSPPPGHVSLLAPPQTASALPPPPPLPFPPTILQNSASEDYHGPPSSSFSPPPPAHTPSDAQRYGLYTGKGLYGSNGAPSSVSSPVPSLAVHAAPTTLDTRNTNFNYQNVEPPFSSAYE